MNLKELKQFLEQQVAELTQEVSDIYRDQGATTLYYTRGGNLSAYRRILSMLKTETKEEERSILKESDLVYLPNVSSKVLVVLKDKDGDLFVKYELPGGDTDCVYFDSFGKAGSQIQPVAFLATPENKQKIETFYGITLEGIPDDTSLKSFEDLLNLFQKESITAFDYGYEDWSEIDGIHNQLVQMFKERG